MLLVDGMSLITPCFVSDEKKRGGAYHTKKDKEKKMDIYLPDMKYVSGELSKEYSSSY